MTSLIQKLLIKLILEFLLKVFEEIDGMVHVSDLSWDEKECVEILKSYKKVKTRFKVKILDINMEKERISLGVKHLKNDPIKQLY